MSKQELVSKILDEKSKYHQGMPNNLLELEAQARKAPYYLIPGWDF